MPSHALKDRILSGGGEVAVIGLARSGRSVARLLAANGARVYASDAGSSGLLTKVATELTQQKVEVEVGRHDLDRVRRAAAVIASPGVPPDATPLAAARAAGVPIVSEIEAA